MKFRLLLQLITLVFITNVWAGDHRKPGTSPLLGADARAVMIQKPDSSSASSSDNSDKAIHRHRYNKHRKQHGEARVAVVEKRTWGQLICNRQNLSRTAWFMAGGVMVGSLFVATGMCLSMKGACQEAESNLSQCNTLLKEIDKISALVCKMDPSLCN